MARVFEEVVQKWLCNQIISCGSWELRSLIEELIDKDIIPRHIEYDQKLFKLLLMQLKRCTASLVRVPSEGYITKVQKYKITAPMVLIMDIEDEQRFDNIRHELESDTGVNIYYYHRLKSDAATRSRKLHRRSSI
jgi:hypothetical protein